MPTKRAILAELTSHELRGAVDGYALQVEDRRVKAQLVDALARSRKARVAEMLQDLPSDRLKELCRGFRSSRLGPEEGRSGRASGRVDRGSRQRW